MERTPLLNILKLPSFHVALVPRNPLDGEGPITHLQNDARAIPDASRVLDDLDGLARRNQKLQRILPLMKRENYFGRRCNDRFVFENVPEAKPHRRWLGSIPLKYNTA
jgi:hypothetical protein